MVNQLMSITFTPHKEVAAEYDSDWVPAAKKWMREVSDIKIKLYEGVVV